MPLYQIMHWTMKMNAGAISLILLIWKSTIGFWEMETHLRLRGVSAIM